MRYGVLVVTPFSSEKDCWNVNLGDMVQEEAILYIYERMGIKREDVVRIEIKDINNYDGEYVILPININLSFNWIINIFPLPKRIIPVFLGLSYFSAEKFPDVLREYFRMYEPIGCRDEQTMKLMHQNGIQAYLYGCVTAVLPKRTCGGNKIFMVDVPQVFCEDVENELSKSKIEGEVEYITHITTDERIESVSYVEGITQELLEKYEKEAKLVVTSRLHCMAPCMAMGVPVIPLTENISPRMGWIDKFLDIYTKENFDDIDWRGQVTNYDYIKEKMINIAIQKIKEAQQKYGEIMDLSYVYETRKKSNYGNLYADRLKLLPMDRKDNLEYIIWGAGQIGMNVYDVISRQYPNSKLVAVIDSYCTGEFFGVPIERPESLVESTKEYIFIATTSGEACALEKMKAINKKKNIDYMSMATSAG